MRLISLSVTCRTSPRQSTLMVDFLVVDRPFAYNIIMGRPSLNKLKAITSTYHLIMKFSMKEGIRKLRGNHIVVRRCYNMSLKKVTGLGFLPVSIVSSKQEMEIKGEPVEELEDIVVEDGKILKIGLQLTPKIRGVVSFLWENMEAFTWIHEDMPRINLKDIVHCLNINPEMSPVKQKRRKFAPERNVAITEEVERLLKAHFIQEVYYPDWLAIVVLFKKSNGK
jgi:hypothetical protein